LSQLNPTVGDIAGNCALIRAARAEAAAAGADLVAFSELVVSGYPPEDLILKPMFQAAAEAAVRELATETGDGGPAILLGAPWREEGQLYNAALLLDAGEVAARRYKYVLPNYGVFDEVRVFARGPLPGPIAFRNLRLGVMICEDMWVDEVSECLMESGADILLVINGSPYERDKTDVRLNSAVARVTETGLPLIYLNQVGGQDELVFDGASFVLGADRSLRAQAAMFAEDMLITRWSAGGDGVWHCETTAPSRQLDGPQALYHAMVLGLGDYVDKNGFPGVLIGLSGGIDSALSAAVAVDALGPERVHCVRMPSRYTSQASLDDGAACAEMLGLTWDTIAIESAVGAFEGMMAEAFAGREADATEENIQARVRGVILMALSNKLGHMVLTTGNKSEMSVGYATLYGDMCGGYSVLKDVYKSVVFDLSRWRNQHWAPEFKGPEGRVIPENIIIKPPSAELRPDQTDQDSLPPYDVLDDILECLIEKEMPVAEIVARGYDESMVARIWHMLDVAEYKRRQAPPGVKLTGRALGRDRRYPITNRFRGTP
ncbi:MAG: NAD+ synthase, partial [Alphaproteobacteria bacterium]